MKNTMMYATVLVGILAGTAGAQATTGAGMGTRDRDSTTAQSGTQRTHTTKHRRHHAKKSAASRAEMKEEKTESKAEERRESPATERREKAAEKRETVPHKP